MQKEKEIGQSPA